jgi:hypothetical protein
MNAVCSYACVMQQPRARLPPSRSRPMKISTIARMMTARPRFLCSSSHTVRASGFTTFGPGGCGRRKALRGCRANRIELAVRAANRSTNGDEASHLEESDGRDDIPCRTILLRVGCEFRVRNPTCRPENAQLAGHGGHSRGSPMIACGRLFLFVNFTCAMMNPAIETAIPRI